MTKVSKKAYDYIMDTLAANGSMSTDDAVELVRPYYDFDPGAAREREIRRYVSSLMRRVRDNEGTRTTFLEKKRAEIVNIDTCQDVELVEAVAQQLRLLAIGNMRSYQKARKRAHVLSGQIQMNELLAKEARA